MDSMGSDFVKRTIVPTPFRGLRVLLVDTDVTARLHIALVLETQFYKVTTTELPTTALAMLHEGSNQFDLIMADVNMPEMDIFAFLKCIKLLRDIPIILMSKGEDKEMALKATAEGVCFFFQKPVSTEQLKNIWQHVNRKRMCLRKKAKNQDPERTFDMKNDHEIGTTEDGNRGPIADHRRLKIKKIESDHVGIVKVQCVGQSSQLATGGSKRKKEGNTIEEEVKCGRGGNLSIEQNERGMDMENELVRTEEEAGSSGKKWRMKWTPDLHHKFTEVISVLGEKACPKRVTQMMNVPQMTHRHVASHLQKYRVQLKQAREALASFANQEGNENGFSQSQNQNNTVQFPRQDVHTLNTNASGAWNPQFGSPIYNAPSSWHVGRPMKVPHTNEDHEFANISSDTSGIEKYMKMLGNPPTGNYSI